MSKPVIGLQLYSLREFEQNAEDLAKAMEKVAAMGYTTVQVSGFGPIDPKDTARIMADNGLKIVSSHTGWDRFQNDLDAVIEEHKLWGAKHLAIGGLGGGYHTLEGLKKFLGELAPVAERLAAEGMTFSYHNHHHELARHEGKTWLERLYDEAPPEMLSAEIDTHWIVRGGGDPAAWVAKYPGRQPLLHAKDMIVTPSREPRFAPVGEGNLNWPAILAAAEEAGVEYVLVEQDCFYEGEDAFEEVAKSCRNLQAMGLK